MVPSKKYRQLDEAQILVTLTRLRDRICERFPESGLAGVANELLALGRETAALVAYLRRPLWPLRCAVALCIGLLALLLYAVFTSVRLPTGVDGLAVFAQATEAAINDLLFLGAAVFFLGTLENRLQAPESARRAPSAAKRRPRGRHAPADEGPRAAGLVAAQYAVVPCSRPDGVAARPLPRLLQ